MSFIHDDFLLQTATARRLYHEVAAHQPILDYHNHLPPKDIAENRQFATLADIWLEGDHYKWRAMRANGVEERFITGEAEPYEKFLAWARTVPHTIRNPLYHWTHLELKRYFGIDQLLDERTAPAIWERANAMLATPELSTHGILKKFRVAALCTTDDPTDDLRYHRQIAESGLATKVYPAYRPDKALAVDKPETWNPWVDRLRAEANVDIRRLGDLLEALDQRHAFFHAHGARLSDHGLNYCYSDLPPDSEAGSMFRRVRSGSVVSPEDHARFAAFLMLHFGRLDAKRGWTKQLHLGPIRNARSRGLEQLGPDTGHDSVGDWPQAQRLAGYLDLLDREDALPKMILYNNNPVDNYVFATMVGNFAGGGVPGKMQFGAGWWYLDTKEGIEWQLNTLSNVGLLSRFVGMLTDSRSFMSYPRHEYFRRVLCNLLGSEIERGELPGDAELIHPLIENICFNNARNYLGLDVPEAM
jgi:glucuronate isomerase